MSFFQCKRRKIIVKTPNRFTNMKRPQYRQGRDKVRKKEYYLFLRFRSLVF